MLTALALALQVATTETVMEVRVHGNHTTPDAVVLQIAGDVVGQPATDALISAVAERLDASGRFTGVEVRKRYRSLDNPNDIVLMIVVNERPGVGNDTAGAGPWKSLRARGMWMPLLDYSDGYGFTYGARASFGDVLGRNTRVSTPFSWGGERQASVEIERSFARGPFARVAVSGGITRRENPHYEIGDQRTGARLRVESTPRKWLRVGGDAGVADVAFGRIDSRESSAAVDATFDTRVDPVFPRNAVLAGIKWEHVGLSEPVSEPGGDVGGMRSGSFFRTTSDLNGYVGIFGSSVLALRGLLVTSNEPLPPYEQALLGGASTLRGYDLGYRAGDNLSAASAELRIPLTSPFNVSRIGLKAFADCGAVYPAGATLTNQRFDAGYGAGVFLTATVLSMGADVAWSEQGDFNFHFLLGMNIK